MAHELPEEIQSQLECIGRHKQELAAIGEHLSMVIEKTEAQLRSYGAHEEVDWLSTDARAGLSWMKGSDGAWRLYFRLGIERNDQADNIEWAVGPASACSIEAKANVVKMLPQLLDQIARGIHSRVDALAGITNETRMLEGE